MASLIISWIIPSNCAGVIVNSTFGYFFPYTAMIPGKKINENESSNDLHGVIK